MRRRSLFLAAAFLLLALAGATWAGHVEEVETPPPEPPEVGDGEVLVEIQFRGLVHYVENPLGNGPPVFLMPRVLGKGPRWARTTPHQPRLVILLGEEGSGSWSDVTRCKDHHGDTETRRGVVLTDKEISFESSATPLEPIWGSPHHGLGLVADMEVLVKELNARPGPPELGGVPSGLFGPINRPARSVLAARARVEVGQIYASHRWQVYGEDSFIFVDTDDARRTLSEVRPVASTVTVRFAAPQLTVTLSNLDGSGQGEVLTVLPEAEASGEDRGIRIVVENAPLPTWCEERKAHFAVHHTLREGHGRFRGVYVPVPATLITGLNNNAQCSPASSDGG